MNSAIRNNNDQIKPRSREGHRELQNSSNAKLRVLRDSVVTCDSKDNNPRSKIKMTASTCNLNTIEDFLADRLSDDQQANFEQHLNECDDCCAALQLQTADVRLWDDTRNYLSSVDNLQ